jgi:hypothetical protein
VADSANKTTATDGDAVTFIDAIADEQRRRDANLLLGLMREVTGQPAVMWGTSIIGSGRGATPIPQAGKETSRRSASRLARRRRVLYLTGGLDKYEDLLARLGHYQTGKGCLYLKRVDQADAQALRDIVARAYRTATGI